MIVIDDRREGICIPILYSEANGACNLKQHIPKTAVFAEGRKCDQAPLGARVLTEIHNHAMLKYWSKSFTGSQVISGNNFLYLFKTKIQLP